jgi:hypothetical protein
MAGAVAVAGCSNKPESSSATVRDSAGVTIYDLRPATDSTTPLWRLADTPLVAVGAADGDENYLLNGAGGATRLQDGRLVIEDFGSKTIRIFDANGRFVRRFGGSGGGPGEFAYIGKMFVTPGDTLILTDLGTKRITVFDTAGKLIRTFDAHDFHGAQVTVLDLMRDQRALVDQYANAPRRLTASAAARDTLMFAVYDAQTGQGDTIGRFPGQEMYFNVKAGGGAEQWTMPFARNVYFTAGDDVAYIGVSDLNEIRAYDASTGRLKSILRRADQLRTVDSDARRKWGSWFLASATSASQHAFRANVLPMISYPGTMPAFVALRTDHDGNLWIREYDVPWDAAIQHWSVYDSKGTRIARLTMPEKAYVLEAGSDYVLANVPDEDDVERVIAYRIRKDGRR